jgi:hypothetical protein
MYLDVGWLLPFGDQAYSLGSFPLSTYKRRHSPPHSSFINTRRHNVARKEKSSIYILALYLAL